jgi:predicted nucleic acid-binding protein
LGLYLDTNVYNRPFDDQAVPRNREETEAVRRLLVKVSAGGVDLVSSFVVETEHALSPFDARREEVGRLIDLAEERVRPDSGIMWRARNLEEAGLKGRDALHLAVAEHATVDYFVTCDDKLLRKARRLGCSIRGVLPTELLEEGTV